MKKFKKLPRPKKNEDYQRYVGVLLETFDRNFKVFGEGLEFLRERVKKIEGRLEELDEVKTRLISVELDIGELRAELKSIKEVDIKELRAELKSIKEVDIKELRAELKSIKDLIESKPDNELEGEIKKLAKKVFILEKKVEVLEKKRA